MAGRSRQPRRVAALVLVIGVVITLLSTWAAARADSTTEQRLLDIQTKQVGAVLSTAILVIQSPLATALAIQPAGGASGGAPFMRFIKPVIGKPPEKVFVSASLWQRRQGRVVRVASVGVEPTIGTGQDAATQQFLNSAFTKSTYLVRQVQVGKERRIGYAQASPATSYLVYAERTIPSDRRAPIDRDSAFSELDYAIYIGPHKNLAALSTTDVDPASLPLTGHTSTVTVPFGDTVLTTVTSPRRHLGSGLGALLPWMLLLGGLGLTLVAALVGRQLIRRREVAEESAATISVLYDRMEGLYGQQRVLSERLQRALLPPVIPDIPHLEVAAEYVAGAHGVDIGGDWYSIVALDDDRFGFVIGDVSGRGIDAVATMARARFTVRAYLLDGVDPAAALEKCSRQFDISLDEHMVTTAVGIGNWHTGEVLIANAGHPCPLLLDGQGAAFVEAPPGPPLGTGPTTYETSRFTMTPGSTLLCFTDGLVERRTEALDVGLARLASTVESAAEGTLDDLVAHTVSTLRTQDADDDIAVLALRWVPR